MTRACVSVLYLALSADLCDLRNAVNDDLLTFFVDVYPQPAIHAFLLELVDMDGDEMNKIFNRSFERFSLLQSAFGEFVTTKVIWGARETPVPIHKLLFANITRLGGVAKLLKEDTTFQAAVTKLEEEAQRITCELLLG